MKYAKFSMNASAVNLLDSDKQGIFNGYQILEVFHMGEYLEVGDMTYFYIPKLDRVVSYGNNCSRAKSMTVTNGSYNFTWKYRVKSNRRVLAGLHNNIKPKAANILATAREIFN